MELIVAKFISPRDIRLVSPDGSRCQVFEAGKTALVHRSLWGVAVQHGLVPENPDEISGKVQEQEAAAEAPKKSQEETVMDGLKDACRTLIVRGDPKDFTMAGQPRAASVKKLVEFNFTTNDVKRAFEEAMHEVEQHGDNGEEHPEPSISAAE